MTLKENAMFDLEKFDKEDFAYFSFRESMKARWKELKHTFTLLKKSPLFFIGFSIIVIMIGLSLFAPYIAPYKCTATGGFLGGSSCEIAKDQINGQVLSALPPLTKDTRITKISWSPEQDMSSQFTALNGSTRTYATHVVNTTEVLVGTNTGKLFLYNYSFDPVTQTTTFTQINSTQFPLPQVPANLTTVIPATGNLDNDTNGTWDIVVGGNTGQVWLSTNNGNLTNPVWSPFEPLMNKVTGQPVTLNGTSSPAIVEYDRDTRPGYGGGLDLVVTSSLDKGTHIYLQRPTAYAAQNGKSIVGIDSNGTIIYKYTWNYDFSKANLTFELNPYAISQTGTGKNFELSQLAGNGTIRMQFVSMDPTSPNSTDVIITFDSGQSYIYLKEGPINNLVYAPFTTSVSSALFQVPPLPKTIHTHVVVTDLTGDGRVDMLEFNANGTVLYRQQIPKVDGRMHWLGTDDFGGDIFSKIIYALQYDLIISVVIVGVTVLIGVIIGSISGYFGGIIDNIFMRITDVFFAFPDLILAMSITAALGKSMLNIVIALVLVDWAGTSRLIRGQVLSEKSRLYVESAKASGLGNFRIIFRHVLPNSIYPIIVTATLGLGGVILGLSGLSFLGFGPQAGSPELGRMVTDARTYFNQAPWMVFFPGLTIMIIVLAFNLVGDAIRDILDPRLRR